MIVKPDSNKSVSLNQTRENNFEVFDIIGIIRRTECVRYQTIVKEYERKLQFNLIFVGLCRSSIQYFGPNSEQSGLQGTIFL
jgi:hypothetical protein